MYFPAAGDGEGVICQERIAVPDVFYLSTIVEARQAVEAGIHFGARSFSQVACIQDGLMGSNARVGLVAIGGNSAPGIDLGIIIRVAGVVQVEDFPRSSDELWRIQHRHIVQVRAPLPGYKSIVLYIDLFSAGATLFRGYDNDAIGC